MRRSDRNARLGQIAAGDSFRAVSQITQTVRHGHAFSDWPIVGISARLYAQPANRGFGMRLTG